MAESNELAEDDQVSLSGDPAVQGKSEQDQRLFTLKYHSMVERLTVVLKPGFNMAGWNRFMAFASHRISTGVINWDLDLRNLVALNSMMLGGLVTLNMVIRSQRGDLRLLVVKGSRVSQVLFLSRLNRIITVMEL